jgi:hypothetical protein
MLHINRTSFSLHKQFVLQTSAFDGLVSFISMLSVYDKRAVFLENVIFSTYMFSTESSIIIIIIIVVVVAGKSTRTKKQTK